MRFDNAAHESPAEPDGPGEGQAIAAAASLAAPGALAWSTPSRRRGITCARELACEAKIA